MILPYSTYTEPELASVGLQEDDMKKKNIEYDIYQKDFKHNDRALCESQNGIYKVFTKKGTDQIIGASLCGGPAGDLISLISTAMHNGLTLS